MKVPCVVLNQMVVMVMMVIAIEALSLVLLFSYNTEEIMSTGRREGSSE